MATLSMWFTSDWHFGHQRILEFEPGRPGNGPTTVEATREHDEILIDQHNNLVAPEDDVWVLGDAAMGNITESLAMCSRMNGSKILVCGNHDRPAMAADPQKRDRWVHRYRDEGGFDQVIVPTEATGWMVMLELLAGLDVAMSHYPYGGDSQEVDRYADRRPVDRGRWLLHGHVHSRWRINGRQINVGVDAWKYQPVHADAISDLIYAQERD